MVPMRDTPFQTLVLSTIFVLAAGTLLVLGRSILLPIVTATILVYLLESVAGALRRLPVLGYLPLGALRLLLLAFAATVVFVLAAVFSATVREIMAVAPTYEDNLRAMVDGVAGYFHFENDELWERVTAETVGRIDLRRFSLAVLGGFTNLGSVVLMVIIYAAFITAERRSFQRRLTAGLRSPEQSARVLAVVGAINEKISRYLAFKTLINIVLGTISYAILWAFNVDFALFWAVVIGVLNYIPYLGSLLAVAFPVALSLAQFGSIGLTVGLGAALTAVQVTLGNIIEPRLIGRQLNLSPFVVLLALALWTTLWGIPGAILAVPLTSILAIVLASFDKTRWLALLLAERVDVPPAAEPTPRHGELPER
ncbi:AI-2E family transporter [Alloyangia pacifica]|uniref:AI-2E family transporter n=1 Tax=Alloyangia pacifica TaxID=311180 RepID=A0A2U8HJR7_9RHOB|nr:AI-2E family transporter [Alloyangia pacifica]AWI85276.1 AI-2E family transporter [Alloyangia pacifica]